MGRAGGARFLGGEAAVPESCLTGLRGAPPPARSPYPQFSRSVGASVIRMETPLNQYQPVALWVKSLSPDSQLAS